MGAGSGKLQDEEFFFFLIDEQPVGFYVELPVLLPLPLQFMVAQGGWKLQVSHQKIHNVMELFSFSFHAGGHAYTPF